MQIISTNNHNNCTKVETNEGTFYIDPEMKVFKGNYPGKEGSKLLDDELYEEEIFDALEIYENRLLNGNSPRDQARKLIVTFFDQGRLNIMQARWVAGKHIDFLIEAGLNETYWLNVKSELYHKMILKDETNPQDIDNVN